jgi:hypothetical protein
MDRPLFYRPSAAATALGVSRATFYRLLAAGIVPSRRIAGVRLIAVDDLRNIGAPELNQPSSNDQPAATHAA